VRRAGFFIATGIAVYFLILVFTLPAVQLEDYIEERVQGLSLTAVSGSVFFGEAGRVSYQGMDLGLARWEFLPWALLTGRVEYHVGLSAPGGTGQANAGVTFAGNVYGHDIDVSFSPDPIIDRYSPMVVETSGSINVLVDSIKLSDGFPDELSGRVVWKSAAILAPVEMIFGDTVLTMQNIGGELVGRIENEADFGLSGEVAIAPGGAYRVDLLLAPDATTSRQTVSLLESTTTVQSDGNYRLRSSGQW